MTPERWQRVAEAFEAALELNTEQRSAFLTKLSSDDPSLHSEVEALLAEDALQDKIPPSPVGAATLAGKRIGGYQISRVVGEGGMGVVFQAEQEYPRRMVALKVIKPGFANAELLRRFERESQVLARLQHPGIAQIYEAGAADMGFGPQPYFAMEFIRGVPLREYAESNQLSTRQRLELMAKVCDAVEHAHQRGIIHRDLKPGNILLDETGQPKILDFGVARVTDSDVQATRQTDVGQLIGTLAYMSPEQVMADPLELDTRSDVYALGVILYELLANRLPYSLSHQLHEAVRAIREEDPTRLSSISRAYRGDVETIVAKALQKDKGRRYTSAAELASDIRRHLADEPITARPASTSYQLRKFARRHKVPVIATAAVFAVLTAGVVVSTTEAVRARRAEQTAQAVNDFLQNDLLAQASVSTQASPSTKPDPDLKVRTALDRAAARIGQKFDRQPEVEADIRDTIGRTYWDLGLYAEARQQLERAMELHRRVLGPKDPKTLKTLSRIGDTARSQGKYPEAERLLSQALDAQRRALGPQHPDVLNSVDGLANVYESEGKYEQAEPLLRETLELERRTLGAENPATLLSMNNLANVYLSQGKYPQAEELYKKTIEIRRRVSGPEHPLTLVTMHNLAITSALQGKYAESEALNLQTLEIRRRILGPEHPDTLGSMNNLGDIYAKESKLAQAEELDKQTLEIRRRVLGPDHPQTTSTLNNLADAYFKQAKYAQAEEIDKEVVEIRRRVLGPEHPNTVAALNNLSAAYIEQGKFAQAEQVLKQILDISRRTGGAEHSNTLTFMENLAYVHGLQGKYAASEALFQETAETSRRALGPEHPLTLSILALFATIYQREGKYAIAERVAAEALAGRRHALVSQHPDTIFSMEDVALAQISQAKFAASEPLAREALKSLQRKQPDDWECFRAESMVGASLAGQKRYAEAEPLLLDGYRGMAARKARTSVPDWYNFDRAHEWVVQLYRSWNKPEKAAEWLKREP
jgi:serine/threonine protein kinase/Tfp pilus assembly protein PilF